MDIFFSYSSVDRERVRPIRDALAAQGFEVFWDQEVPTGLDWDTWIRQHLAKSKCAIAFWSAASIASRNVRHEATIADQQGKLIAVMLEPLTAQQFPMGLYAQQAANLAKWDGDLGHEEWRKLRHECEAKLMQPWVRQRMDEKDAELVAERARRQGAERRDKILQAQIAKEAEIQQELKRECDEARDEVVVLKAKVEELTRARSEAEAKQVELRLALTQERDEVVALKAKVEELARVRSETEALGAQTRQDLSALAQAREHAIDTVTALRAKVEELIQARTETARELGQERDLVAILKATIEELARGRSGAEARVGLSQPAGQSKTTTPADGSEYWKSKAVWQRAGGICAAGVLLSFVFSSAWPLLLGVIAAAGLEWAIYEEIKRKQASTGRTEG